MRQASPKQNVFIRSAILVIFEIILFAAITPFLWFFATAWSIGAAGVAAGLCTASAVLAIFIHDYFCDPKFALTALLASMTINMGVPLFCGIAIHLCSKPLSQAGFIYYLVFFYLLTLAIKTILILPVHQKFYMTRSPTNLRSAPDRG
jgi:hypothetical protein